MIESTSQKLQSGGAEREARELAEQIIDALPGLGDTTWLAQRVALIKPLLEAFAARCANEARLEAHDEICTDCQAHVERKKFIRCKRGAELERAVAGIDAAPVGDKSRALKAAHLDQKSGQHEN